MDILLVDDHPIVLEGIKTLLSKALDGVSIVTAANVAKAKEHIRAGGTDILITDLDLNNGSGMNLIDYLTDTIPDAKIIIYTMHEEPWTVQAIADCCHDGVVMKSDSTSELLNAVKAVAQGKGYYSRSFCTALRNLHQGPEQLSGRERQVLDTIVLGLSADEAACQLGVTKNTIEFHRRRIMRKLNAANAAEVVRRAMEMGWNANI